MVVRAAKGEHGGAGKRLRASGLCDTTGSQSGRNGCCGMLYKRLACHSSRLLDAHQLEDCRSHVSELTVLHLLDRVTGVHHDERNVIQRVSCVRCTVLVDSVVSVTVVSCDEDYVTLCLSCLNYLLDACVNGCNRLADSLVNACMTLSY